MLSLWKSDAVPARLPARVQAAISAQQDAAEWLIGWFQLAVVVIFGLLYTASPKTFAADVDFTPVPWALGIYFALYRDPASARLSRRHRPGDPVSVDCARYLPAARPDLEFPSCSTSSRRRSI